MQKGCLPNYARIFRYSQKSDLFSGICTEHIGNILVFSNAEFHRFEEGEYIFTSDQESDRIILFLEGRARIINRDYTGNTFTLMEVGSGDIFGEVYSLLPCDSPSVSVQAVSPTSVVIMDSKCVTDIIPEISLSQEKLKQNLLRIMAKKILCHIHKIEHISRRSTRQKLLSYFTEQMIRNQSQTFDIPFSRQELADYLSVDRSAMSSELSKMQKDGLIKYNMNHFEIIQCE